MGLLRVGAAAKDKLGGDLGPGAKAADADIAAAELLADHDHAGLGEAKAAELFRDRQTKYAHLCQLGDDLHRDQLVL